eukprot:TRINITY_DN4089_c0_g1_i1.p1 TRINITY_DN4089_c0_g1~~TRINITY_DN4089_c0_g1_i1.p1  ORF type:complete len:1990 (+),score=583.18 TRINITY_DN4089_c0_g1_i1:128-5971(+)
MAPDPLADARRSGQLPDKHVLVLCVLPHDSWLRRLCSRILVHPRFNTLVLVLILSNSLLMAVSSWRPKLAFWHDHAACPMEVVFTTLFTLEMLIKVLALGMAGHRAAYLTSMWNCLDGIIVLGSIVQLGVAACDAGGGSISILRVLRVLRPLRSMARVKGMRIILRSLFAAMPPLMDNVILIGFLMFIIAILGVQLFHGTLHRRCYATSVSGTVYESDPNITVPRLIDSIETRCGGSLSCTDHDVSPLAPDQVECAVHLNLFEHGPLSWDNVGLATVLVFKLFTGDDWPDDMFQLQNSAGSHVWLFFFITFMVGVLFATNLFLAVLIDEYLKAKLRGEWIVGNDVVHEERGPGVVRSVDDELVIEYDSGGVKTYPLDTAKVREMTLEEKEALGKDLGGAAPLSIRHREHTGTGGTPALGPAFSPHSVPMWDFSGVETATGGADPPEAGVRTEPDNGQTSDAPRNNSHALSDGQCHRVENGSLLSPTGGWDGAVDRVQQERANRQPAVRRAAAWLTRQPPFDHFVLAVTFINVLVLAVDHHKINEDLANILTVINIVCTSIFIAEILLKLFGVGPRETFRDGFNCLDGVLVAISIPDLAAGSSSEFTAFRALKALKIVGKWKSIQRLVRVVTGALSEGSYISLLLLLEIFIFSILGMQLFEGKLDPEERRHYDTLWEAALSCFVVITGDAWAGVMKGAMASTSNAACLYFLALFLIGNFIVINVFTAVILGGLGDLGDEDEEGEGEPNEDGSREHTVMLARTQEEADFGLELDLGGASGEAVLVGAVAKGGAAERAGLAAGTTVTSIGGEAVDDLHHARKLLQQGAAGAELELAVRDRGSAAPDTRLDEGVRRDISIGVTPSGMDAMSDCDSPTLYPGQLGGPAACRAVVALPQPPGEPLTWRQRGARIASSRAFDAFMVAALVANVAFLALESPRASADKKMVLEVSEIIFTVVFTLEMLFKMFVFGIWRPKDPSSERPAGYLRDPWNVVDCIVVMCSLAGLVYERLNVLRSARTLRLIVRVHGIRVLVSALIASLPAVSQGIVLVGFLFLVFAIFGVQIFKGRFYACSDDSVYREADCNGTFNSTVPAVFGEQEEPAERTWEQFTDNFDNLWNSLQSLFIVALGEGWSDMMYVAMDTTGVGTGPSRNAFPEASIFFVLFHIIGGFFSLNLIIGIIIDTFIQEREKIVSAGLSELPQGQRARIAEYLCAEGAMRKAALNWEPQCPEGPFLRRVVFAVVHHPVFENFIITCIMLNGAVFATVHYGQPNALDELQEACNYTFTAVFIMEAVLKITALGIMYFQFNWNRFDFTIVMISVAALGVPAVRGISAIRVLRLARLLRLVAKAKGLQKLFNVIFQLDNIVYFANVSILLAAVFFIFACVGQSLFSKLKRPVAGIDHNMNFETVPNAMLTLFTISTTEAWLDVRDGLTNTADCGEPEHGEFGACGSPFAVVYVYAFMVCGFTICLNVFSAVVCELHGNSNEEEHFELGLSIVSEFRDRWQARFGPRQQATCAQVMEGLFTPESAEAVGATVEEAAATLLRAAVTDGAEEKDPPSLVPRQLRISRDELAQVARKKAKDTVAGFGTHGVPQLPLWKRRRTLAMMTAEHDGEEEEDGADSDSSDDEQGKLPQLHLALRLPAEPTTRDVLSFLHMVRVGLHRRRRDGTTLEHVVNYRDIVFALSRNMFGSTPRKQGPPLAGLRPGDMEAMRAHRLQRPRTPHHPLPHEMTLLHYFVVQRIVTLYRRIRELADARQQRRERARTRQAEVRFALPAAAADLPAAPASDPPPPAEPQEKEAESAEGGPAAAAVAAEAAPNQSHAPAAAEAAPEEGNAPNAGEEVREPAQDGASPKTRGGKSRRRRPPRPRSRQPQEQQQEQQKDADSSSAGGAQSSTGCSGASSDASPTRTPKRRVRRPPRAAPGPSAQPPAQPDAAAQEPQGQERGPTVDEG